MFSLFKFDHVVLKYFVSFSCSVSTNYLQIMLILWNICRNNMNRKKDWKGQWNLCFLAYVLTPACMTKHIEYES